MSLRILARTWQYGRIGVLFGMLAIIAARSAHADLAISVDFDPFTNGIQNSITVGQGQSIFAELVLEYSDAVGLDSYRFSVQFDDTAMSYSMASSTAIANFSPTAGPPVLTPPNTVGPFEAASDNIFAGPNAIAPIVVGSVTFSAGLSLGSFSITPFEDGLFDGSFNNNAIQITPVFNAGTVTITSVPEPSSLTCTVMIYSLLSLYRRRVPCRKSSQRV